MQAQVFAKYLLIILESGTMGCTNRLEYLVSDTSGRQATSTSRGLVL